MSRFVVSALRQGPEDLRDQLPVSGVTVDSVLGPDGDTYVCARLDRPLVCRGIEAGGSDWEVTDVVMRAAQPGQQLYYGMRGFAVELAYALAPSYALRGAIDFSKVLPVATVEIDSVAEGAAGGFWVPAAGSASEPPVVSSESAADRERVYPSSLRPTSYVDDGFDLVDSGSRSRALTVAVVGVLVFLVAGIGAWWLFGSSDAPDEAGAAEVPSSAAPTTVVVGREPVVPPGYGEGACAPAGAADTVMTCGPNSDPGGPQSATYTVLADRAALEAAFGDHTGASEQVVCPGNIQSPGPWRRNANPEVVAGTLFCGSRDGRALIVWTDAARTQLNVADAGLGGPPLEQLYAWWTTHS